MLKFIPDSSKTRLAKSIKVPINSGVSTGRRISARALPARFALSVAGGWLLSNLFTPVYAAAVFNNSGIQFDEDTTLETQFIESHGAYQSTFGVIDLSTNEKTPLLIETKSADDAETIFKPSSRRSNVGARQDFSGTPGNVVETAIARYTFKAKTNYVFYLESTYNGRPTGVLYSSDVLNPNREKQVLFSGSPEALCTAGMTMAWDDTGSRIVRSRPDQDRDFDDFLVGVRQIACAMGDGEKSPVAPVAQTPPVGALPTARRPNLGWLALLGLGLPLLFIRGGDDGGRSSSGGGGLVPPILPPPNGSITPPPPVPEPFSIFGSIGALGAGALLERRRRSLAQRALKVAPHTVQD